MTDTSPAIANAVPASVESATPNNTGQPIPLSRQQPPVPTEPRFAPALPAGWQLLNVVRDLLGSW